MHVLFSDMPYIVTPKWFFPVWIPQKGTIIAHLHSGCLDSKNNLFQKNVALCTPQSCAYFKINLLGLQSVCLWWAAVITLLSINDYNSLVPKCEVGRSLATTLLLTTCSCKLRPRSSTARLPGWVESHLETVHYFNFIRRPLDVVSNILICTSCCTLWLLQP